MRLISLFEQDQTRPRRERRTAVKLYEHLVKEGYTGSYSPVCRFITALKADGTDLSQAFIPLHFKAGDALQFDWSEEHIVLGGVNHKIKVAHFRLGHSRKPFVVAYPGEERWSYYFDQLAARLRWIRVSFRLPNSLVLFFFHKPHPASIFRG